MTCGDIGPIDVRDWTILSIYEIARGSRASCSHPGSIGEYAGL